MTVSQSFGNCSWGLRSCPAELSASMIIGETGGDALDEGAIGSSIIPDGGAVEKPVTVPGPDTPWWKVFDFSI